MLARTESAEALLNERRHPIIKQFLRSLLLRDAHFEGDEIARHETAENALNLSRRGVDSVKVGAQSEHSKIDLICSIAKPQTAASQQCAKR